MLNILGLGLRGVNSLTIEELSILKSSTVIYFETYTSISPDNTIQEISKITGKDIIAAERNDIEHGNFILNRARTEPVSVIVTGDALSATTHNQLRLEAMEMGIEVNVYENASIITAFPSKTGLFNYKFGNIVSLPFTSDKFFPLSVYDKIYKNYINGMHTLILLDLLNGKTMEPEEAVQTLLKMEEKKGKNMFNLHTNVIVGISIADKNQRIIYASIDKIIDRHVYGSPAALILPVDLNDKEKEFINKFCTEL